MSGFFLFNLLTNGVPAVHDLPEGRQEDWSQLGSVPLLGLQPAPQILSVRTVTGIIISAIIVTLVG